MLDEEDGGVPADAEKLEQAVAKRREARSVRKMREREEHEQAERGGGQEAGEYLGTKRGREGRGGKEGEGELRIGPTRRQAGKEGRGQREEAGGAACGRENVDGRCKGGRFVGYQMRGNRERRGAVMRGSMRDWRLGRG